MKFSDKYFEPEVRAGYYVPSMMKRCWAAQLEVLDCVGRICQKHGIAYSAYAGTLLGAIRHGGFVPWDDDMDLCMLRKDCDAFLAAAEKELPEGYSILDFHKEDTEYMLLRVINTRSIEFSDEFLERTHGFPYMAGLDLFIMDNLPEDTEKQQKYRDQMYTAALLQQKVETVTGRKEKREIRNIVRELTGMYHIKVLPGLSLRNQVYTILDWFCRMCSDTTTENVANMVSWFNTNGGHYRSRKCFSRTLRLPFENTEIAVGAGYTELVNRAYEEPMRPVRGGTDHRYPYYTTQTETVIEKYGKSAVKYQIPLRELQDKRPALRGKPKEKAKEFIRTLAEAHVQIERVLDKGLDFAAVKILEVCQDGAIKMGTMLEETEGEDFAAVQILEEYCDQVFACYQTLTEGAAADGRMIRQSLDQLLDRVDESVETSVNGRREVLFLPFKAEGWRYLEKYWKEACEATDCRVHVVPVPYHIRTATGKPGTLYYEGDMLPEYVQIEDYQNFDFNQHRPDVVYFQNPYDEYDSAISTLPAFTSKKLRSYTDKLVYVPYFCVEEFGPDDECAMGVMEDYCVRPGLVYADQVIVQSENMKQRYIETLTKAAGEDSKPVWEEKILAADPPIIYHAPVTDRKDIAIPDSWMPLLKRDDGHWKKIVLYMISAGCLYYDGDQALRQHLGALEEFRRQGDQTGLILCFDQTEEAMMPVLDGKVREELQKQLNEYRSCGWCVLAQPSQMKLASDLCDVFCGDMGNAMFRCMMAGKTVLTRGETLSGNS